MSVPTFATHGDELSYHARAVEQAMRGEPYTVEPFDDFKDIVRVSRDWYPGLGVIAVQTVMGTVTTSVQKIASRRAEALPDVVWREDYKPRLVLIGGTEQIETEQEKEERQHKEQAELQRKERRREKLRSKGIEPQEEAPTKEDIESDEEERRIQESMRALRPRRVCCLAQKEAFAQCYDETIRSKLPHLTFQKRRESIKASREAVAARNRDIVAIGPDYAAAALGGFVLSPRINPENSVTSFLMLQRDPRDEIIPPDPARTRQRTVVSLAHPVGTKQLLACFDAARQYDIGIARIIPFDDMPDYRGPDNNVLCGGGLIELDHGRYDPRTRRWCAKVAGLGDNNGGNFSTVILGGYPWYPEPNLDMETYTAMLERSILEEADRVLQEELKRPRQLTFF